MNFEYITVSIVKCVYIYIYTVYVLRAHITLYTYIWYYTTKGKPNIHTTRLGIAWSPRYLPPAGSQTPVAGPNFDDSMAPSYPSSAEVHIMRYKLPEPGPCFGKDW